MEIKKLSTLEILTLSMSLSTLEEKKRLSEHQRIVNAIEKALEPSNVTPRKHAVVKGGPSDNSSRTLNAANRAIQKNTLNNNYRIQQGRKTTH